MLLPGLHLLPSSVSWSVWQSQAARENRKPSSTVKGVSFALARWAKAERSGRGTIGSERALAATSLKLCRTPCGQALGISTVYVTITVHTMGF